MSIISFFFIILIPRPPRYTLFPYTTLFRSHTFSMINENNERVWVKFHIRTQQGIENLTNEEAREIIGRDRESNKRDLFDAIERGDNTRRTMMIQVMTEEQAKQCTFNTFDMTKV